MDTTRDNALVFKNRKAQTPTAQLTSDLNQDSYLSDGEKSESVESLIDLGSIVYSVRTKMPIAMLLTVGGFHPLLAGVVNNIDARLQASCKSLLLDVTGDDRLRLTLFLTYLNFLEMSDAAKGKEPGPIRVHAIAFFATKYITDCFATP